MKLQRAFVTVGFFTLISRVLGFGRDLLMANYVGAGPIADALVIALKFPNFFRRIFAEGAFSSSFVPIFTRKLTAEGQAEAQVFAQGAIAWMVWVVAPFCLLMMLIMPLCMWVLAPGFIGDAVREPLTITLSRLTFPFLFMMAINALQGGMLNASGRFAPFAITPIIFNVASGICLIFLTPYLPNAGYALAWGIVLAGVVQNLYLGYCLYQSGYRLKLPALPPLSPDIKLMLRNMLPGIFATGVVQINMFVDMTLASFVNNGPSYLYYADRLNQLPIGLLGGAIGTALLPMLTKALKQDDKQGATELFSRTLEICWTLGLPAMIGLVIAAEPIQYSLFAHGKFTAWDARASGFALSALALGIPAYLMSKALTTAFLAREDTKTPMRIGMISTACNIVFSLTFMGPFQILWGLGHVGIGLATAISAWVQIYLLRRALIKRGLWELDARLISHGPKIFKTSFVTVVVASIFTFIFYHYCYGGPIWLRVVGMVGILGSGLVTYVWLLFRQKLVTTADFKQFLKK